ncbi:MAG TPA: hypothetical protein VNJ04_12125 [Gemmatimonadaceae bacterium]|nr:hypothetical protein [Gemmatimonadaceae bacterium]
MNLNKITLYATVAGEVLKIGMATVAQLRGMQTQGAELDAAALDRIAADYDARIARRSATNDD